MTLKEEILLFLGPRGEPCRQEGRARNLLAALTDVESQPVTCQSADLCDLVLQTGWATENWSEGIVILAFLGVSCKHCMLQTFVEADASVCTYTIKDLPTVVSL